MYHNVRDKTGRFAPKKNRKSTKPRKARLKKEESKVTTILNAFLLDNSTSMAERGKDAAVVMGFNKLLQSGREDAAKNKIDNKEFLAFFDNNYGTLTQETRQLALARGSYDNRTGAIVAGHTVYNPSNGGSTALDYSAYRFIKDVEREYEKYNPTTTKVVLTIFTDGEENHSVYHNAERPAGTHSSWQDLLKALVEEKNKEGWVVTYVGAGDRATVEATAVSKGFYASNSVNFANNAAGASAVMDSVMTSRSAYTSSAVKGTSSNKGFFQKEKQEKV